MSGSENPFQDVNEDGVHIVTLPKFLDEPKMKALEVQMKSWLLMSEVLHVFDFSETKKITPEFARPFTVFRSNLRKAEKFMASVNASQAIQKDLNGRGLKDVFNWVPEINVARREAGLASTTTCLRAWTSAASSRWRLRETCKTSARSWRKQKRTCGRTRATSSRRT